MKKVCPTCEEIAPDSNDICQRCGEALLVLDDAPASPAAAGNPSSNHHLPSGCDTLHVEYNIAQIFQEGLVLPLQFRITPLRADLRDLRILFQVKNCDIQEWIDPPEMLRENFRISVKKNFQPPAGLKGRPFFDFYFFFRDETDNAQRVFNYCYQHTIYPAKAPAQSVIKNLRIDLKNEQAVGDVSDTKVQQAVYGLEKLVPKEDDPISAVNLMLIPPMWCTCSLHPVDPSRVPTLDPAKPEPPPASVTDQLTLHVAGRRLHIFCETEVVFGRGNTGAKSTRHRFIPDIWLRIFENGQRVSGLKRISSTKHARLSLRAGRATLQDLNSTAGTWAGDQQIDQLTLSPGQEIPITFGRSTSVVQPTNDFIIRCLATDASGHAEALLITRPDLPEAYLLMDRTFSLGEWLPELNGAELHATQGGIRLQQANGKAQWLQESDTLQLGGTELRVISRHEPGRHA